MLNVLRESFIFFWIAKIPFTFTVRYKNDAPHAILDSPLVRAMLGSLVFTKEGCPSMHVEVVSIVMSVPISVYACLSPIWATTKARNNGLFHADIKIKKKGRARCMVIILVRELIYY
jgi:hypothetical protein